MNIEDLGITKQELVEKLVDNLSNMLYESIKDDVEHTIKMTFQERIEENVDSMATVLCREAFEVSFQPIDHWGEPTSEKTTLKEMLKNRCIEFWNDKVDSSGEKTSYSKTLRYQFVAEKTLRAVLDNDLKKQADDIFNEVKNTVKKATTEALAKQLVEKL